MYDNYLLIEIIGEEGMPLAKEIIIQAEEMKARPYFKIINNENSDFVFFFIFIISLYFYNNYIIVI